mmetsp:Transcript_79491/g.184468  ORF Transcript_79491/g.184468 Transcript_79491/m.184468 type:complete len:241 (-) Transcript_79491:496-1218(-)
MSFSIIINSCSTSATNGISFTSLASSPKGSSRSVQILSSECKTSAIKPGKATLAARPSSAGISRGKNSWNDIKRILAIWMYEIGTGMDAALCILLAAPWSELMTPWKRFSTRSTKPWGLLRQAGATSPRRCSIPQLLTGIVSGPGSTLYVFVQHRSFRTQRVMPTSSTSSLYSRSCSSPRQRQRSSSIKCLSSRVMASWSMCVKRLLSFMSCGTSNVQRSMSTFNAVTALVSCASLAGVF